MSGVPGHQNQAAEASDERRRASAVARLAFKGLSISEKRTTAVDISFRPFRAGWWLLATAALVTGVAVLALTMRIEYAPLPAVGDLANPDRYHLDAAYDVLGRTVTRAEADALGVTGEVRAQLTRENGAIAIDPALITLGREAFYRESFRNEVFLTDVLGLLDGAVTPWAVTKAVIGLVGRGTSDLKVRLAKTVTIGGRTYEAGSEIATGLDVPRGGLFPLGIKMVYDRGRVRAGITCAACHSTVESDTGMVIEGAPNADFNVGLLLALASNSAAYFAHTTMPKGLAGFRADPSRTVTTSTGAKENLPDPAALERAVDTQLAAWPRGNFDSTVDLINNPTQIPDSFTAHGHPYGWSGFGLIGPFQGLSVLNNNVHALNSDATAAAMGARALFELDPEVYLGTLLQNAPNPAFRFDASRGGKPSEVLAAADPTRSGPGLNEMVRLPTYPKASYVATDGLLLGVPGYPVWEHVNAMSAFQNTLRPPSTWKPSARYLAQGRAVFEAAGCAGCHSGPALTNNRVLPVAEVGSEATRAKALAATEKALAPPVLYPPSVPVPLPADARAIPVSMDEATLSQVQLAWGHAGTEGGYKVKGLIGLAWTAPYLHDGGVAVGPRIDGQIGVPGTSGAGVKPDPRNSLLALIDRELRARVIAANKASSDLQAAHVTGEGHPFWADAAAGVTPDEQKALLDYLIELEEPLR